MQRDGQGQFADALINPDAPLPEGIVDPKGNPAPKRFSVYQNNVIVSLTEALAATFPAVAALVGEAFFKEMARLFARSMPPTSPLLTEYGRDFPDFIAEFAPAAGLPFLRDVGRLDRAWLDAYHETDAAPLDPASLAGIEEAALVGARFNAHPALRIVASDYPVAAIWQAGKSGEGAAGVDPQLHQSALVTRPDIDVHVVALTPAEGLFFVALMNNASLGEAAEKSVESDDAFDLPKALGLLISSGAFTDIQV